MMFLRKRPLILLWFLALASVSSLAQVNYLRVVATQSSGANVKIVQEGSFAAAPVVEYKIMDGAWTEYAYGTNLALAHAGDSVIFRGNNVSFTNWSAATTDWVKGVSPEGYFVCPASLPVISGINNIPNGWVKQTPGPIVLATDATERTHQFVENNDGYCLGIQIEMPYSLVSGAPAELKMDFDDNALNAGFENITWSEIPSGNVIQFDCPAGTYTAQVVMRDEDMATYSTMTIYYTVNIDKSYTTDIYDDVISIVKKDYEFFTYQWYRNGVPIEGAPLPYYQEVGGLSGTYYVEVVLINGDKHRTCDFEVTNVPGKNVKLMVYPNPSLGNVNVKVYGFENTTHMIQVMNAHGAVMMTQTFEGQQAQINISHLQQGTYMICVDGVMSKIVKL